MSLLDTKGDSRLPSPADVVTDKDRDQVLVSILKNDEQAVEIT